MLPRKLPVVSEDRYQLLSSDSKQVPELHSFVCSLDFCNAVLQVSPWGRGRRQGKRDDWRERQGKIDSEVFVFFCNRLITNVPLGCASCECRLSNREAGFLCDNLA